MSKEKTLTTFARNLETRMGKLDFTSKNLSAQTGIPYTTLMPILSGTRDCSLTRLLAIANALRCEPNEILKDLYTYSTQNIDLKDNHDKLKITAIFISQVKMTYCSIHILSTNQKIETSKNYALQCGKKPSELISDLYDTISESAKQLHYEEKFSLKNVAVFIAAQQYDRPLDKQNIENQLKKQFHSYILEADYAANYYALFSKKDGICISINDGCAITYSKNKGAKIEKLLGYGFPISDVAGNFWLGCEAVRHTIQVAENIDVGSTLSDRLLALYDSNVNALSEAAQQDPHQTFLQAASIVKELYFKQEKSHQIVQQSASELLKYIEIIDKTTKKQLPILLAGELAYLYTEFMPEKRLIQLGEEQKKSLLKYGSNTLADKINNEDQVKS